MKRQYISPSIYARKVVFQSTLATLSSVSSEDATTTGASVGGADYGNGGNGLSKGGWLDDEEEDY